jgi:hypothetical protein
MSNIRISLGVGFLVLGSLCGLATSLIGSEMQGEVNARLPQGEQLEAPWWFGKQARLLREHRRLFPGSTLRAKLSLAGIAAVGCHLALAFLIGFFS